MIEEKEIEIIVNLLNREIENFKDVFNRTTKECWLSKVKELENLKEKVKLINKKQ